MHSSRFHSHLRLFILGSKLLQLGYFISFFFLFFLIFLLSTFNDYLQLSCFEYKYFPYPMCEYSLNEICLQVLYFISTSNSIITYFPYFLLFSFLFFLFLFQISSNNLKVLFAFTK